MFAISKIMKIKECMKELGGVYEAAELMLKASTWEVRMRYGGKALIGLAAELTGVTTFCLLGWLKIEWLV
jgi:hypothetical protein